MTSATSFLSIALFAMVHNSKMGSNIVIGPRRPKLQADQVFVLTIFPWEQKFDQVIEAALDLGGQIRISMILIVREGLRFPKWG